MDKEQFGECGWAECIAKGSTLVTNPVIKHPAVITSGPKAHLEWIYNGRKMVNELSVCVWEECTEGVCGYMTLCPIQRTLEKSDSEHRLSRKKTLPLEKKVSRSTAGRNFLIAMSDCPWAVEWVRVGRPDRHKGSITRPGAHLLLFVSSPQAKV